MKKNYQKLIAYTFLSFLEIALNCKSVYTTNIPKKAIDYFQNKESTHLQELITHCNSNDHIVSTPHSGNATYLSLIEKYKNISLKNNINIPKKQSNPEEQKIQIDLDKSKEQEIKLSAQLAHIQEIKQTKTRNTWVLLNKQLLKDDYCQALKYEILSINSFFGNLKNYSSFIKQYPAFVNIEAFWMSLINPKFIFSQNNLQILEFFEDPVSPLLESFDENLPEQTLIFFNQMFAKIQGQIRDYLKNSFILSKTVAKIDDYNSILFLKPQNISETSNHTILLKLYSYNTATENCWKVSKIFIENLPEQIDKCLFSKTKKLSSLNSKKLSLSNLNFSKTFDNDLVDIITDEILALLFQNIINSEKLEKSLTQNSSTTTEIIHKMYDSMLFVTQQEGPEEETQTIHDDSIQQVKSEWLKYVIYVLSSFFSQPITYNHFSEGEEPDSPDASINDYDTFFSIEDPFSNVNYAAFKYLNKIVRIDMQIPGFNKIISIAFSNNGENIYFPVRVFNFNQSPLLTIPEYISLKSTHLNNLFLDSSRLFNMKNNETVNQSSPTDFFPPFIKKITNSRSLEQIIKVELKKQKSYLEYLELSKKEKSINTALQKQNDIVKSNQKKLNKIRRMHQLVQDQQAKEKRQARIKELESLNTDLTGCFESLNSSLKNWLSDMVDNNNFLNRNRITAALIDEDPVSFFSKATSIQFAWNDRETNRPIYFLLFPFKFLMFVGYPDNRGAIMLTNAFLIIFESEKLEHIISGFPAITKDSDILEDKIKGMQEKLAQNIEELKEEELPE